MRPALRNEQIDSSWEWLGNPLLQAGERRPAVNATGRSKSSPRTPPPPPASSAAAPSLSEAESPPPSVHLVRLPQAPSAPAPADAAAPAAAAASHLSSSIRLLSGSGSSRTRPSDDGNGPGGSCSSRDPAHVACGSLSSGIGGGTDATRSASGRSDGRGTGSHGSDVLSITATSPSRTSTGSGGGSVCSPGGPSGPSSGGPVFSSPGASSAVRGLGARDAGSPPVSDKSGWRSVSGSTDDGEGSPEAGVISRAPSNYSGSPRISGGASGRGSPLSRGGSGGSSFILSATTSAAATPATSGGLRGKRPPAAAAERPEAVLPPRYRRASQCTLV